MKHFCFSKKRDLWSGQSCLSFWKNIFSSKFVYEKNHPKKTNPSPFITATINNQIFSPEQINFLQACQKNPEHFKNLQKTDPKYLDFVDFPLLNQFFLCCSLCHTVVPEYCENDNIQASQSNLNELNGGQTDAQKSEPAAPKIIYQASSPDEGALVQIASEFGYKFIHRTVKTITITRFNQEFNYKILATLDFTSARQMMSVLLEEDFGERNVILLTKGSDSKIYENLDLVNDKNMVLRKNMTDKHLTKFSTEGLRTLCFSYKVLGSGNISDFDPYNWVKSYIEAKSLITEQREIEIQKISNQLETKLNLIGASAIEDKLQDKVPQTISNLQKCGIHIWMLTGDKVETAQNIGYSSNLIDSVKNRVIVIDEETLLGVETKLENCKEIYSSVILAGYDPVLVISGQSLRYALAKQNRASFMKLAINMKTVICARVSPSQKAEVVKLVTQTLGKDTITLAIGDGANDVPMIQEANIGVGISGKEGLQAANSSDYALPQFRFLEKLLLVHGVWNYYRVTKTILYSFYWIWGRLSGIPNRSDMFIFPSS